MTVARLMVVRTVDGKITVAPAPWTLTDRINALHAELWAIEPGYEFAERRDATRMLLFALYRKRSAGDLSESPSTTTTEDESECPKRAI